MRLLTSDRKVLTAKTRIRVSVTGLHRRPKPLTIGLSKATEQVDGVGDEVLELSEGLSVDHDITSLNWLVNAETREDLVVFTEEDVGLSRDL